MATTSPDNIRTPDPGDAYNLVPDLANMAGDVQDALIERGNSYKGTSTQRTSFTASAADGVLWQDTNSPYRIWRKQGGSGGSWAPLAVHEDSGWITFTPDSPWTVVELCRYRKINGVVYLRGRIAGVGDTAASITTLPGGYRPTFTYINMLDKTGGALARVAIFTDGNVSQTTGSGSNVSANVTLSAISFPVG